MARSMFSSLEPNTTYTHPSSHGEYHTDEYGRVAKFSADPRITSKEERERNTENQRTLEGKGPGYEHAGHLVSDRHGGSGEKFDIVPMQEAVDSRDYAAFEKETDGILQRGYNVHYNGEICYSGAETVEGVNRSEAIMVERQTIDPESGAVVDRDYTSLTNMNMTEFENVGNRESEELMAEFSNPNAVAYDEEADLILDEATGAVISGPAETDALEEASVDGEAQSESAAETDTDSLSL